jgi:hypothetical protein
MVEFHFNHTATRLVDGRVLVAGSGPNEREIAELYDPGNGSWTATAGLTAARYYHTATLLPDGKVLVAGGAGDGVLASAELYDPATGRWAATGSMPTARFQHTATLLPDGTVLVAGGYIGGGDVCCDATSSAELYDPSTGEWTATGEMAGTRTHHRATPLPDGRVLVVGGVVGGDDGGGVLSSAELYDPISGQWTSTGSMADPRFAFTATVLGDGKVLVAGGASDLLGEDVWASAELYDPSSGQWTATGSMTEGRSNDQTGTLLLDGRVLVAGGRLMANADQRTRSAELYDPSTGQWIATATMVVARVGPTATLLSDGTVLVTGGDFSGGPEDIGSSEIYDPH